MRFADTGSAVALKSGRMLGVLEFGDPDGRALFYFHGHPGSRLEAVIADEPAKGHGLRMIALDRPGYGLSDDMPGRQILDWPRDVAEIADQRAIEHFGVIGVSGGGPYAAACAYAMPERVVTAALVAGVGPFDAPYATDGMMLLNRLLFRTSRSLPFIPVLVLTITKRVFERNADVWIERMSRFLPPKDRDVLRDPEIRRAVVASTREAFRQGARKVARDTELYARPWGFDLAEIKTEVHVFQGERDLQVPPAMGHYQAETIPGAEAHFYDEDGHLSLAIGRIDDVLSTLSNSKAWETS